MLAVLATLDPAARTQGRGGTTADSFGPEAARGNASIVGHVMSAGANTPVRAADVVATSTVGAQVATKTDENGAYRLEGLPASEVITVPVEDVFRLLWHRDVRQWPHHEHVTRG